MVHLIVQLSKYIMIILFLIYTFLCFHLFKYPDKPKKQRHIYNLQRFYMFLIHLDGFLVLFVTTMDTKIIGFYIAQLVLFESIYLIYHKFYKNASELVLNNMVMMLCISMIILTRISFDKALRQFVFVLAGTIFAFLIPLIMQKGTMFRKLTWTYAGVGILGLLSVLVVGVASRGAKLSLTFGPVSIQPSEFVKILFVFFIASMLYKSTDLKQLAITSGVSAVFVLILVASNDLGGALLYFFTYLVMIYVATKKLYIFAGGLAFVGLGMYAGYHLFSHVKNRIVAWLDPLSVIDKAGYQVCQSLFAIGTGGLFGFGLGQGMPNKIPIVSKDFIIAAISEEMGGIFAVCLIMVCVSCFLMIFNLSMQMKDAFYKYVALGLGSVYALQVLLTVGGSTKFIPMTGVTLPLVSYGGSSLLSTMIIFGMIQGMYIMQAAPEKRRNIDDKRRKDHETKNRQKQTAKEPGAQESQQRRRKPAAGGKNSTKTQK